MRTPSFDVKIWLKKCTLYVGIYGSCRLGPVYMHSGKFHMLAPPPIGTPRSAMQCVCVNSTLQDFILLVSILPVSYIRKFWCLVPRFEASKIYMCPRCSIPTVKQSVAIALESCREPQTGNRRKSSSWPCNAEYLAWGTVHCSMHLSFCMCFQLHQALFSLEWLPPTHATWRSSPHPKMDDLVFAVKTREILEW